jgi:phage shock protein PspC (stress-responsive transcriptional regulator)
MKAFLTIITWIVGALLVCLGFLLVGTAAYAVGWLLIPFKIRTLKTQK